MILIPTCNRTELLTKALASIRRYTDYPVMILDEGENEATKSLAQQYRCEYLCTKKDPTVWRMPGYAYNIAVKTIDCENILLSCGDIYHVDDCITPMLKILEADPKAMVITRGKDDVRGDFLNTLDVGLYRKMRTLDTKMHFLLGIKRSEFLAIGGYDEDFRGSHYDDNDFTERLIKNGCNYQRVDARIVHLYHPRPRSNKLRQINRKVYWAKKDGPIVRNADREWGRAYA